MIFLGDKIDYEIAKDWSLDLSKDFENQNISEEIWEIDSSKLEIEGLFALGRSGILYQGTYDTQDVAVKLLELGGDCISTANTDTLRASIKREIAIWHNLDHPNIAKLFCASMGESRACCIVMEYLKRGALVKLLHEKRKEKLPFKIVIKLALDLARGLSYLHSKKIIHRDVNAGTMLLDSNGNLKIAHFGLACVEAENPKDSFLEYYSSTGALCYVAPEVLYGKAYNRKCDIYSFGICLWEIYCCDQYSGLYVKVAGKYLLPDIPRCCPSSLANIMKRCWDANPERRPEMDEVVSLLEGINTSRGGGMIRPKDKARSYLCFAQFRRGP